MQKKTFTKWVQSHLRKATGEPLKFEDLYVDLRDGRVLLKLLEVISRESLVNIKALILCTDIHQGCVVYALDLYVTNLLKVIMLKCIISHTPPLLCVMQGRPLKGDNRIHHLENVTTVLIFLERKKVRVPVA